MRNNSIQAAVLCVFFAYASAENEAVGASKEFSKLNSSSLPLGQLTSEKSPEISVAQKSRSKKTKRKGRKRFITGEARTSGASTSIDFGAASIEGERKAPVGVAVGETSLIRPTTS